MGRRVGIDQTDITRAAARIADRDGLDSATLTAVAGELGIRTPSLYNHVDGLAGMRRLLALRGSAVLLEDFGDAVSGRSGAAALRAIARSYRAFATAHPGLYASFLPAPEPGEDDVLYDAMAQPVHVVAGVLLEMGIPAGEAIHLIRALRSLLHGFLDLESKSGFGMPVDIDASFEAAIDLMISAANAVARNPERG